MTLLQNWVFYSEDNHGVRTIQAIKECSKPELTNEYKHNMAILDFNNAVRVGYMTATAWNENITIH